VIYQDWDSGVPPLDNGANSSVIGLQYVYTIQKAVEMFRHFGMNDIGQYWSSIAEKTKKSIYENCWDDSHNMIADTPEKKNFSQHANLLAVLADAIPVEQQKDLVKRTFEDTTIAQASYYFKFYLAEALKKTEMRESYLDMLNPWEEMLNNGLTTFQEEPDPSRSDCHAWSASPLYHFYTIVCGIDPQDPGFKNINISPSFGELKWIKAKLPHRSGLINIDLNKKKNGRVIGEIILPDHMNGTFYWDGTAYALISGVNKINY
jgi:hypothetical protein